MPESRFKYLYERLGDQQFQLLAAALLTERFPEFVPMPVRQADGGRDGRSLDRTMAYQVKWSVHGAEKDPVTWLDAAVKTELDNLTRLQREGLRRYVLVTNVPSTAAPGSGTNDRLQNKLDDYGKALGVEMSCFWRETLDAMVDFAPNELKWTYADMLAGWDLIRYLIAGEIHAGRDRNLREIVRKVAAAQWRDDELVKFSQVDIDREKVADLFVDVTADRLRPQRSELFLSRREATPPEQTVREPIGGVARHLLNPKPDPAARNAVLVRGAPGQGKSTLAQFVAQAHRAAFVSDAPINAARDLDLPLFPLRVDLSDYARWLSGVDVWDPDPQRKRTKGPAGDKAGLECFLAALMTHASGGMQVTPDDTHDLLSRLPSIVVLDGLDEVGRPAVRRRVVEEIDRFVARNRAYMIPPRVIVTTRPSTNALPEPSLTEFDVLVLNPLQPAQREEYLRKWTSIRSLTAAEARSLRRTYKEKIAEPYLDELAGNPMQLTILLDLLHKHGAATPTRRTALYDAYVELLLAREANKHPKAVRTHQDELREVIPFLGWHLHAHNEADREATEISLKDLKATIRHFQTTYGNNTTIVDDLFEAATDRLWTLTSKNQGAYQFEVLSLREHFAARFLYRYAGEDTKGFDRLEVFRALLTRPYWLNTTRFYAGNADGGVVSELADGLIDQLIDDSSPQTVVAGWTLLTDGVFNSRPRRAREVLDRLCSDDNISHLAGAFSRGEITRLPELPMPAGDGPDPTWTRLTRAIAADPQHPSNRARVWALRTLLHLQADFASWWSEQIRQAQHDPAQVDAWLQIAAHCEGAAGVTLDLERLDLTRPLVAQEVLNTGLVPTPDGPFEKALLHAVLDGRCPDVTSVRSLPAQVAVAFARDGFLTVSGTSFNDGSARQTRRRTEALQALRKRRPNLAAAAASRKYKRGEANSTFPWANTATALHADAGPSCWLPGEIAIIAAASPHNLAITRHANTTPFGPAWHPETLLEQTRVNATNSSWWREQLVAAKSEQDRARWCLALWCVAAPKVVTGLLPEWERTLATLPATAAETCVDVAGRVRDAGWLKPLPDDPTATDSTATAMLRHRQGRSGPQQPEPKQEPAVSSERPEQTPLLLLAREREWFKVDSVGAYR